MDSIKPEKDDIDLHRSAKSKPRSASKAAAKPAPAMPKKETAIRLSRSAQWALVLAFLLVVSLVGMGYWQVNAQQNTIKTLEGQLTEANSYISQSKLIIARLQGQINQTDATMAQSGNEMARELKFLDEEMRKLWDVSNKRNKQWIQENQKSLKKVAVDIDAMKATADEILQKLVGLQKGFESVEAASKLHTDKLAAQSASISDQGRLLSTQQTSLTALQQSVNVQQDKVAADLKNLSEEAGKLSVAQKTLAKQLGDAVKNLQTKLDVQSASIEKSVAQASSTPKIDSAVSERLNNVEASMNGLDKVRVQLVQRIVQMEDRINELQLKVSAMQSGNKVSAVQ